MPVIRFPPDSFDPDHRVGILNPTSSVQMQRDGIERRRPPDATRLTYLNKVAPVNQERHLDALTVCQLAMSKLLRTLTFTRVNLEAMLESDDIQSSQFVFSRVAFDWPRREENIKPVPMAVILPNGEGNYDMPNLETSFDEQTEDAYQPGTVIRETSYFTQELMVHVLMPHKEERRAVRKGFEVFLLSEPDDDFTGRRQIVQEYYNRQCRINLLGMTDGSDDDNRALANEWELQARFQAQVPVVQLVTSPGRMQAPINRIVSGNSLIGNDC